MVALLKVQLSYKDKEFYKGLESEVYQRLRKITQADGLTLKQEDISYVGYIKAIIEDTDIDFFHDLGFNVEITKWKSCYPIQIADAMGTNSTVHIHLPNLGIMMIDEVTNLDDACTDNLQDHLNLGWRIIAICPPNGARRPDYILGRTRIKED